MHAAVSMHTSDPHAQLRALYRTLLESQERFDEFKQLLSLYMIDDQDVDEEPREARAIRAELNARIHSWLGEFDGLSATQVLQWRAIVVDERFNVALSPWKESNGY